MFHGSLEELYLPQEPQVTSEQPPPCSRKMYRSVSMAYLKPCFLKPLREGPRERSLSQEGSMTEASTDTVSHRSSSARFVLSYTTMRPCFGYRGKGDRQCPPLNLKGLRVGEGDIKQT